MEDQNQGEQHKRFASFSSQDPRYTLQLPTAQNTLLASNTEERYRIGQSISSEETSRSFVSSNAHLQYYHASPVAFSATNLSEVSAGYDASYGPNMQEQTPGFGSYNTEIMMYNVPQESTQTSLYDAPPFCSPNDRGTGHYPPSEITESLFSSIGTASVPTLRDAISTTVPNSGAFLPPGPYLPYSGTMSGLQNLQAQPEPPNISEDIDERKAAELETKWHEYQRQLGTVFDEISGRDLERAATSLLTVSVWLLSQIPDLGLNEDNVQLHSDRLKLWNDFNHAWLSLANKQKACMVSGNRITRVEQPLSKKTLKRMGDELIRLCDGIEKHGLVDYQCGVWEDEIEALLEECLDLYESSAGRE